MTLAMTPRPLEPPNSSLARALAWKQQRPLVQIDFEDIDRTVRAGQSAARLD